VDEMRYFLLLFGSQIFLTLMKEKKLFPFLGELLFRRIMTRLREA
jgi:hypothetical protein